MSSSRNGSRSSLSRSGSILSSFDPMRRRSSIKMGFVTADQHHKAMSFMEEKLQKKEELNRQLEEQLAMWMEKCEKAVLE